MYMPKDHGFFDHNITKAQFYGSKNWSLSNQMEGSYVIEIDWTDFFVD